MIAHLLMKVFPILCLMLQALPVQAAGTTRVAVLPFEIYSDESGASLKDLIAEELSSRLAAGGKLEVVDQARVRNTLADRPSLTFNEATLRTLSQKLEAPFLVLGSMTKIADNVSLDAYVFSGSGTQVFLKEFSEGKNLDSVTKAVADKVSARILLLAPPPPEQKVETPRGEMPPMTPEVVPPEKTVREDALPADTGAIETGQREEAGGQQTTSIPPPPSPAEPRSTTASLQGNEKAYQPPRGKREKAAKEEPLSSPFSSTKPVKITSQSLEADNKRNLVTFKGSVVARQGDMVIHADTMTVGYEKEGGIKQVEAFGNVKMSQADRVATGSRIIFYNPEQKIVMTGNPKIWQGDNLISCEKITVLLEEDKIFFEGKVDSTIFPRSIREEKQTGTANIEAIPTPPASPR